MFTGLIEEVGSIVNIDQTAHGCRYTIGCAKILSDIKIGDSVAVSGACQSVELFDASSITIFSIPETLTITHFKNLQIGTRVNLERALRVGDRLGGHIVQGHVEATAKVVAIEEISAYNIFLEYDSPYIIAKGSVCLDGISLTVMEKLENAIFRVQIIPETLENTNIRDWKVDARINIEVDYIIKSLDHVRLARESARER